MINFRYAQKFCCDDISLVENYEQAINDKNQTWHCHHRLETDLGLSAHELKEQNRYFKVPAAELIFLTPSEHMRLHHDGENSPMYGKNQSEESNRKRSEKLKGKKRADISGEKNGMYGIHPVWMNNGIIECMPKTQKEIEHYRNLGYTRGRLPFRK